MSQADEEFAALVMQRFPDIVKYPPFARERLDLAAEQLMEMHEWERTPQNKMNALEVLYATKVIDNILSPADREIYANPTEFLNNAPAEGVKAYLQSMETHLPTPEQQAQAAQEAEDHFIRTGDIQQVTKYLDAQTGAPERR